MNQEKVELLEKGHVMLKIYVIKYAITIRKPILQDINHYDYTALILSSFTRKKFQRLYIRLIVNWLQF